MTLGKDNHAFQDRYYIVGTGVVRMHVHWTVCGHGIPYTSDRLDHRGRRRGVAPHGPSSSGWLVRLLGHVKASAAFYQGRAKEAIVDSRHD